MYKTLCSGLYGQFKGFFKVTFKIYFSKLNNTESNRIKMYLMDSLAPIISNMSEGNENV